MTRSQGCRDRLGWIEENCPLDRTSIIPIKKASDFCYKHVEISTLSTDAVQPLVKIKDTKVQEKVVAALKIMIDSGKKPTRREVVNCIREEHHGTQSIPAGLPDGKFDVILADPPWKYEHTKTTSREIENQYPSMDLDVIKALKVPAAENAVLLLWTTAPKIEETIEVMNAWGFKYRTCAIWDKGKKGMGYWFRIQHELLLVGVKGNFSPPLPENRFDSVIRSPRTEHSEKPTCIYKMIEKMFPDGKKIELFARSLHLGWISWGDEV